MGGERLSHVTVCFALRCIALLCFAVGGESSHMLRLALLCVALLGGNGRRKLSHVTAALD